jgi:hypothetical protein
MATSAVGSTSVDAAHAAWVLPRTGDRLPHDELISILGSGGIERVLPRARLTAAPRYRGEGPHSGGGAKPEMRLRFEPETRAMAGRDNLWT